MAEDSAEAKFFIHSHNEEFHSRQTNVFDQLNELESKFSVKSSEWKKDDFGEENAGEDGNSNDDPLGSNGQHNAGTTTVVGESPATQTCDASFKIPTGVPLKRIMARPHKADGSSVPAFSANPDQWTKYSLASITTDDMSEESNTGAAMDFLASRWKTSSDYEEICGEPDKQGSAKVSTDRSQWLEFGKFVMPEYTVGRGTQKTSAKILPPSDPKLPKVKLSFLNTTCSKESKSDSDELGNPLEEAENSDVAAGPSLPVKEPNGTEPVFRSVRSRKRNIRQASISIDDED